MSHLSTLPSTLRHWPLAALVALATVFLAACSHLDDESFGFWDLMWGMVAFFFWFMLIWIWITCLAAVFRRNDLSGRWKAIRISDWHKRLDGAAAYSLLPTDTRRALEFLSCEA